MHKIFVIPLVIVLGLTGLGIVIFEQFTGVGPAISAYRDNEEKCRKLGLIVTAEELNTEYNIKGPENAAPAVQEVLTWFENRVSVSKQSKMYQQAEGFMAVQTEISSTEANEGNQNLTRIWSYLDKKLRRPHCRFERDFRLGIRLPTPEYDQAQLLALGTMSHGYLLSDKASMSRAFDRVTLLRLALADNYESDAAFDIQERLLAIQINWISALLVSKDKSMRDVGRRELTKLESEPARQLNIGVLLKFDLLKMFTLTESDRAVHKDLEFLGFQSDDQWTAGWMRWKKYPRALLAWRSIALGATSRAYTNAQSNPILGIEQYPKWLDSFAAQPLSGGIVAQDGWPPLHLYGPPLFGLERAKQNLAIALAKFP